MFHASGCTNITSSTKKQHVEFWTKALDPSSDRDNLANFYKSGMLTLIEKNFSQLDSESESEIFWKSLQETLKANKKGVDGKIRILSIIADNFTYRKLKEKLGVSYKLYFIDLYNKFYKKKNITGRK